MTGTVYILAAALRNWNSDMTEVIPLDQSTESIMASKDNNVISIGKFVATFFVLDMVASV